MFESSSRVENVRESLTNLKSKAHAEGTVLYVRHAAGSSRYAIIPLSVSLVSAELACRSDACQVGALYPLSSHFRCPFRKSDERSASPSNSNEVLSLSPARS